MLLLLPFLDRASARGEPGSTWRNLALAGLLYVLLLTYLGYTGNPAL